MKKLTEKEASTVYVTMSNNPFSFLLSPYTVRKGLAITTTTWLSLNIFISCSSEMLSGLQTVQVGISHWLRLSCGICISNNLSPAELLPLFSSSTCLKNLLTYTCNATESFPRVSESYTIRLFKSDFWCDFCYAFFFLSKIVYGKEMHTAWAYSK